MDYVKEIAELREKINWNKSETDIDRIELCHREVRNELALKREQVIHLKKELQETNSRMFQLGRELESNKSLLKESEFNLKLALKKSASLEEKMKEISESHMNLKLKEEMRLSEIQILNDNIQKISHENHRLSREVEEFNDKFRYSRAFQDELEDRQSKINTTLAKTKQNIENLEKEQAKVVTMEAQLNNAEELQNINQLLLKENEKLKSDYLKMEDKFIETSAKYEKLHHLIKGSKDGGSHQENILGKLKYLQWENQNRALQRKNINNEQIITTLTNTLQDEIETNAHLLQKNEEQETRIKELENKMKVISIKQEDNQKGVIEVE